MANLFDALSANVFATAATTMGSDASWAPSSGGAQLTARVLFRAPARGGSMMSAGIVFRQPPSELGPDPVWPTMEYRPADLPGLLEAVRGGSSEVVSINGTNYNVAAVDPVHDGNTYLARFEAQ